MKYPMNCLGHDEIFKGNNSWQNREAHVWWSDSFIGCVSPGRILESDWREPMRGRDGERLTNQRARARPVTGYTSGGRGKDEFMSGCCHLIGHKGSIQLSYWLLHVLQLILLFNPLFTACYYLFSLFCCKRNQCVWMDPLHLVWSWEVEV